MYRFKDTPQELPELVIDALNLFGHGIRQVWFWSLLVAIFSLVGPYLIFESIELIGGKLHATIRWGAFLLNILSSIPGAFCIGMITRRLFCLGADHEEEVFDSMRLVGKKLIPVYCGLLIASFISILGWFFIYLPGIFFGVVFTFVTPLILLDDYGIIAAFKESWNLVWGNWWRIFAMLFFPLVILAMVSMVTTRGPQFFSVIIQALVVWFDIPLLITFVLTMFYDTKLRHEVPLHLPKEEKSTAKKTRQSKKKPGDEAEVTT